MTYKKPRITPVTKKRDERRSVESVAAAEERMSGQRKPMSAKKSKGAIGVEKLEI